MRKGFTLIELLVVISIIAVLMAILMPSLQRARKSARAVVCQSNLRQWGTIVSIYTNDHDGHLPSFIFSSENIYNSLNDRKILFCPMAVKITKDTIGSTFEAWNYSSGLKGSYGCNVRLDGLFGNAQIEVPSPALWPESKNIFNLKNCYSIPLMLDSTFPFGDMVKVTGPPLDEYEQRFVMNSFCINRHEGCVNSLFLNWSVRKVGLKELWKLKWNKHFDTNGPWTLAGGVKSEDWPEWMRGFKDY